MSGRLPEWIREKRINLAKLHDIKSLLREKSLHSVCESLACPNRSECFSRGTATFMILGDICTRSCGFCNVTTGRPYAPPAIDASLLYAMFGLSPAECRIAIQLAEGLSLKELEKVYEVNENALKVRLFRARQRVLKAFGAGPPDIDRHSRH